MMEGFVRQLPFSAESDGVHVQDDKLRSETSTDTNEIEMNDDNHDSSVKFDEDCETGSNVCMGLEVCCQICTLQR